MVLGVDIGKSGAAALLTPAGELIEVADLPVLNDGPAGRPAINAALLAVLIRRWQPGRAYVEHVASRPGEAPTSAFGFGLARGTVSAVLACVEVPTRWVTPAVWKRTIGIPPGKEGAKDRARSEAIRRWPGHAASFARVRDDGRAEAALIAVAGMAREAAGK